MIEDRESYLEDRESCIEDRESCIEDRESDIEDRESAIDPRGSRIAFRYRILSTLAFHITEVQKRQAKAAIHAYQLLVAGTVDKKPAHRNYECSTNLGTLP